MMLSFEELKELVFTLGRKIGLEDDSKLYPKFFREAFLFGQEGSVYIDDNKYHYVVQDHGRISQQYEGTDVNDILYPMFKDIVWPMSVASEKKYFSDDVDFRRLLWKKQLELLKVVNPDFAAKYLKEIKVVLKDHPFDDGKGKDLF